MRPVAAAMDAFTCLTPRSPPFWQKRAYWAENSFSPSKRTSPGPSGAGRKSYRSAVWLTRALRPVAPRARQPAVRKTVGRGNPRGPRLPHQCLSTRQQVEFLEPGIAQSFPIGQQGGQVARRLPCDFIGRGRRGAVGALGDSQGGAQHRRYPGDGGSAGGRGSGDVGKECR